MPFANFKELLRDAKSKNSCVAAFNCYNYESVKTVVDAGEHLRAPVIVMLYPALISHIPLAAFAHTVKDLAERSQYPVGIHLDHCADIDLILTAVKAGFQSVIVDASRAGYEANADLSRRVVKLLRPYGADVEAELGIVGSGGVLSDYLEDTQYTDPVLAKKFVEDTAIDCLAVAVGNAHGHYAAEPKLDIKRLNEINRLTGVPLALHGGSGIPDAQLKAAVINGVAKTNFGTDFMEAIYGGQRDYISSEGRKDAFGLAKAGVSGGLGYAENRIRAVSGDE